MSERYLAAGVEWRDWPRHYAKHPGYVAKFSRHGFRYVTNHPDEAPLTDDDLVLGLYGWVRRGSATNPEDREVANRLPTVTKRPFPPAALAPLPVTEYRIRCWERGADLEKDVEKMLSEGWVCQGGVTMDPDGYYLQAMIRTTP